jgi:hypothetical protein
MGWLRDMMAQTGLRSFGELARQALNHPDWPKDSRAQPRSLEAILGRLDRREDLDWLSDRPGVQQVLSALLKSQVAEIRSVLLSSSTPKGVSTRLRLDDLPTARAIELQQEALPPTLPPQVALPATWRRIAWLGPPGSGFSLVGHWLLARGLAQSIAIETIDEYRELPVQGPPLFLEVPPSLAFSLLSEFTDRQGICIALAMDSKEVIEALEGRGFEILRNAPVLAHIERVVDWVIARSTQGCQTKRDGLLAWLTEGPMTWRAIETLGELLGFIGAYLSTDVSFKGFEDKTRFYQHWFSSKVKEHTMERLRDNTAVSRLLPQVLIDIAQSVLLDDQESLLSPRSLEDWLALVPEQHQQGPDLDWLSAQAAVDPTSIRPRDIARAAKRLPPGAHRIVVALRELSILRPVSATRFALRPHFISRLLHSIAIERTVNTLPLFWGEALLKPKARPILIDSLSRRIEANPESLAEEILEVVDAESAPLVCALEVSFVLLGLESLAGAELSESTVQALLEEQHALLFLDLGPLPVRRTMPFRAERIVDTEGAFFLSAFALAENHRRQRLALLPLLDPFRQPEPQEGWGLILDAITETIQRALIERPRWLLGALQMLDRIRQIIGSHDPRSYGPTVSRASDNPARIAELAHHPLFYTNILLDALDLGVFDESYLRVLLDTPWQFELLLATIEARGKNVAITLGNLWAALVETNAHTLLVVFVERLPNTFWVDPPILILIPLLFTNTSESLNIRWDLLSLKTWTAWSLERAKRELSLESTNAWKAIPHGIGEELAKISLTLSSPIRQIIWERWPAVAIQRIERVRALHPVQAADWLDDAPVSATETVANATVAHEWHKADSRLRTAIARLLHRGLKQRVAGWPLAYDCLQRFEVESRRF